MSSYIAREAMDELLPPLLGLEDGHPTQQLGFAHDNYDIDHNTQYSSVNIATEFDYTPSTAVQVEHTLPTRHPDNYYSQDSSMQGTGAPDTRSDNASMPPPLASLPTQAFDLPIPFSVGSFSSVSLGTSSTTTQFGELSEMVGQRAMDATRIATSDATSTPLSRPPGYPNLYFQGREPAQPHSQRFQPRPSFVAGPTGTANNSTVSRSGVAPRELDASHLYPRPSRTPGMRSMFTGWMASQGQVGVRSFSAPHPPLASAPSTLHQEVQALYNALSQAPTEHSPTQPFVSQGAAPDARSTLEELPADARHRVFLKPDRAPATRVRPPHLDAQATGTDQVPVYSATPLANPVPRFGVPHPAFNTGFKFASLSPVRLMPQRLYPSPTVSRSTTSPTASVSAPPTQQKKRKAPSQTKTSRETSVPKKNKNSPRRSKKDANFPHCIPVEVSANGNLECAFLIRRLDGLQYRCGAIVHKGTELGNHFIEQHATPVEGAYQPIADRRYLCSWPECVHGEGQGILHSSVRRHAGTHFGLEKVPCPSCGEMQATQWSLEKRHKKTCKVLASQNQQISGDEPKEKKQRTQ